MAEVSHVMLMRVKGLIRSVSPGSIKCTLHFKSLTASQKACCMREAGCHLEKCDYEGIEGDWVGGVGGVGSLSLSH